jgi:hypothetical protein
MSTFIELRTAKAESIAKYKSEVKAITIDRAAYHVEQILAKQSRPTKRSYEKALQDALLRAKLDVMAELFEHMQRLARPHSVADWDRESGGLKRRSRSPQVALELIGAYDQVVRDVARMKIRRLPGHD